MAHSRETEHYQLPLYNGTDIINPLTDFNNANEKIDETMYNVAQRAASAEESAQQSAGVVHDYDERVAEAEQVAEAAGIKADNTMNMIAEEFDPLKEGGYKIGDSVIYNEHLYTFINPHSGAWDASDVVEQPIGDALNATIEQAKVDINNELDAALAQIDSQMVRVPATQAMIAPPFEAEKEGGYDAGKMVTYADKLYVFNEHHDGAWTGTDVTKVDIAEELNNVDAQITEVDNKLLNNLISSQEQFYSDDSTDTFDNKIENVIRHVADLFSNAAENVGDIIVDGIDMESSGFQYSYICAWSMYDYVVRGKKLESEFIQHSPDPLTGGGAQFSIHHIRARNNLPAAFTILNFVGVMPEGQGTAGNQLISYTEFGKNTTSSTITIAYHYLYKV